MRALIISACLIAGMAFAQEPAPSRNLERNALARVKLNQASLLSSQVKIASDRNRLALSLGNRKYVNSEALKRHHALVGTVYESAKTVDEKQDKFSRVDLAMTRFLLAKANAEAGRIERRVAREEPISDKDLAPLADATAPLMKIQKRQEQGEDPLLHRTIKVTVQMNTADSREVEGLRVYVLPKDMFERPEMYRDVVDSLLAGFSFEKLTSPSEARMPVGEFHVWVGPEYGYAQMAQLIQRKQLTQFKPVHAQVSDDEPLELTFYESDVVAGAGRRK